MPVSVKHEAKHDGEDIVVEGIVESHSHKPLFEEGAVLVASDIAVERTLGGGLSYRFLVGTLAAAAAKSEDADASDDDTAELDAAASERTSTDA